MTEPEHVQIMRGFSQVISTHDWDRLGEFVNDDAVFEYPQSGERFEGLSNVRGQFENYPDLGPGTSELSEIVGDTAYALTPSYTLIAVDGSGGRGTAVVRVRYPDGSLWWALTVYELRDGRIGRLRTFFAPDFEPPDWRAPFRAAP
jgi:ketosteroid isomerase-like protein